MSIDMQLLYLDTNLWNGLLDQKAHPQSVVGELARKHASLVLSDHTVYELSRTHASDPARAQELFGYLKHYVDSGIVYALAAMEQLHREVNALMTNASVTAFYDAADLAVLKVRVAKLARGIYDEEEQARTTAWDLFSRSAREGQNAHFKETNGVSDRLRAVSDTLLSTTDGWKARCSQSTE